MVPPDSPTQDPGLMLAGASGMGFKIVLVVGLYLTELILGGASKTVDITALAPDHFASDNLVKGSHDNVWK